MCVCVLLNHFAVHKNITRHCESTLHFLNKKDKYYHLLAVILLC